MDEAWLADVAAAASRDADGTPAELLGDYLTVLAEAAAGGRRATASELAAVTVLGRRAAEEGISAGRVVHLYISAARRLWLQLPEAQRSGDSEVVRAASGALLRVVEDAVAALVEAYAAAGRQMARREEALRRDLIDDLVRGDADVGALVERAEPFGLRLGRPHRVAVAAPGRPVPDAGAVTSGLERALQDRLGDALAGMKDGALLVIVPAAPTLRGRKPPADLGDLVHGELDRLPHGGPWRVALGRPYPGAYGIARSYEEAREALALAERLRLRAPVTRAEELLVYRVLVRDEPAMADLVQAALGPLTGARGGAGPFLETLEEYFATGGVATETARRMHLSVRAVTYRLDRIRRLTGYDPADPEHRFTLHAAVLGAKVLGWPRPPADA